MIMERCMPKPKAATCGKKYIKTWFDTGKGTLVHVFDCIIQNRSLKQGTCTGICL